MGSNSDPIIDNHELILRNTPFQRTDMDIVMDTETRNMKKLVFIEVSVEEPAPSDRNSFFSTMT